MTLRALCDHGRVLVLLLGICTARAADPWPCLGGPKQDFAAPDADPPVSWSESDNVRWRTAVPGRGWSSPVVGNGKVWVTTAVEDGRSLRAVSVDVDTGRLRDNIELLALDAPEPIHKENSHATPTPILRDGRLYAAFGNSGHVCLNLADGRILWRNTELKLNHKEGPAATPALWNDLFIVTCDGTDMQYIAALHKDTGTLVWRQPRSLDLEPTAWDRRKAFSTPLPVTIGDSVRLLNTGSQRLYCNDARTGRELWHVDHPGFNCPALIRVHNGVAYLATSFMTSELLAVRLDPAATGNVTDTHVLWRQAKHVPRISTPILVGDRFFMVSDQGVASWIDAATGRRLWRGKLSGRLLATPLYAGGRLYLFDDQGLALVLAPEDVPRELARNRIDGGCRATPAVAGNALIVRSKTHLLRLETSPGGRAAPRAE